MDYQYLHVEEHGKVLVLRMDDPETRNSMRPETMGEFLAEIARFEKSTQLRCLVLTGTDPAFCSGATVRGQVRRTEQGGEQQPPEETPPLPWAALDARYNRRDTEFGSELGPDIVLMLMRLQKPSIAAVNGYAVASGSGLALACDIRIMSEKAYFAETFIRVGGVPGDGSLWQLPRMIGLSNTYLHAYLGDRADAETCLRWGLVSKVVPHDQLIGATLELATRLAEGPVYAMGLIKYMVQQSQSLTLEESLRLGRAAEAVVRNTFDHKEGMLALREKRPPLYQGR